MSKREGEKAVSQQRIELLAPGGWAAITVWLWLLDGLAIVPDAELGP